MEKIKVMIIDEETDKLLSNYIIKKSDKEKEIEQLKLKYNDVSEDCDGDIVVWE